VLDHAADLAVRSRDRENILDLVERDQAGCPVPVKQGGRQLQQPQQHGLDVDTRGALQRCGEAAAPECEADVPAAERLATLRRIGPFSRAAAEQLADAIAQRQADWLKTLGQPRRDAAVRQLVSVLPEQPVIDVAAAQRLTGKSHVAIGRALQQLEDAGIIVKLNERKWGRVWECDKLLGLVDTFERNVRTATAN
jgi:DNA-binding transcriptional ArsR family regulator